MVLTTRSNLLVRRQAASQRPLAAHDGDGGLVDVDRGDDRGDSGGGLGGQAQLDLRRGGYDRGAVWRFDADLLAGLDPHLCPGGEQQNLAAQRAPGRDYLY